MPSTRSAPLPRPPRTALAVVLLVALVLGSCAGISKTLHYYAGGLFKVEVIVDPELNQNAPLAVDLVLFYEKSLFTTVRGFEAAKWFEQRSQIQKDFRRKLHVHSWEWVPARPVEPLHLDYRPFLKGVIVFAGYQTPGAHREVISPLHDFTLKLGKEAFSTESRKRVKKDAQKAKEEEKKNKQEAAKAEKLAAKEAKKKKKALEKQKKKAASATPPKKAADGSE